MVFVHHPSNHRERVKHHKPPKEEEREQAYMNQHLTAVNEEHQEENA